MLAIDATMVNQNALWSITPLTLKTITFLIEDVSKRIKKYIVLLPFGGAAVLDT